MILNNLYLIVAMTEHTRSIGKNGDMLYHLPKDLNYFKNTTLGHTIVMGYNTYLSLPKRPLPNRTNIVLSRKVSAIEGVKVLDSINKLISYIKEHNNEHIFACGGQSLYNQLIPYASKLYVTSIEENETIAADRFFPEIDYSIWQKTSDEACIDNKKLNFTVWERKYE